MRFSPFRAPALAPACALIAGAAAVQLASVAPQPPLLVVLLLLGIALGRLPGVGVAALAIGALLAAGRDARSTDGGFAAGSERVVEVVGTVVGHPVHREEGWSVGLRASRLRVGSTVRTADLTLLLGLPDGDAPPLPGSVVRARGQLSRPAPLHNGVPTRPGRLRLRVKNRAFLAVDAAPPAPWRLSAALRSRADAVLKDPGGGVALARALVLGDASAVPLAWQRGLRRCGLTHLLSVSGVHVALLLGLLHVVSAGLPRALRAAILAGGGIGYALLVGPLPPLLRSLGMALVGLFALARERPPFAANALAVVAAGLVAADPSLALDLGFQLSAAATAGLVLGGPLLVARWRRLPRALATALAATVSAQLASLPFALPVTPLLVPLAPLWNLLAMPWAGLTLAVALGGTLVGAVVPATVPAFVVVLDLLAAPVAWSDALPPGPLLLLPVVTGSLGAMALAMALAVAAWWPRVGLPVLAVALVAHALWPVAARRDLVMLDVGQGDAILLRSGSRGVLVDGGGWPDADIAARVLLPALVQLGVRHLDAVAMTHPDRDHCGGLVDLASYLTFDELWMSPGWEDQPCARELLARRGPRLRHLVSGDVIDVGGWRLDVLHPSPSTPRSEDNERSLVLRATTDGGCALLTGDIGLPAELELLREHREALRCTVLKVAHHGSRNSTVGPFLDAVGPHVALVSTGARNPYGHPSPVLLERFRERRVPLLRTDRLGQVRVAFRDGGVRLTLAVEP